MMPAFRDVTPSQMLGQFSGAIIGPTESVIAFMGLAPQHNEHCKAYRWHWYVKGVDLPARAAAVQECAAQMIAEARARRNGGALQSGRAA